LAARNSSSTCRTGAEGARLVAERLRIAFEAAAVPTERGAVRFTASIGVATFGTDVSITEATELADRALYRAKQGGRNRVEVAAEAPAAPQAVQIAGRHGRAPAIEATRAG
jgi:PleD family two-component response regulator